MDSKRIVYGRESGAKRIINPEVEKVVEISLERLRPFENHPFKVKEDKPWPSLWKVLRNTEL